MLCRGQKVTGTLTIDSWGHRGRVVLTDGEIITAEFGDLRGSEAIRELAMFRDGMFTLHSQHRISLTPSQNGSSISQLGMSPFDSATQVIDTTVRPAGRAAASPPPIPTPALVAARGLARVPTMQIALLGAPAARSAPAAPAQNWTPQWVAQPAYAGAGMPAYQHSYGWQTPAPRPRLHALSLGLLGLTMLCSLVAVGM